jgi:L-alanine-DL-glutamate epimerase-like enolase superfamily enzyme
VKVAPDAMFDVEMCRLVSRLVPGGYELATALAVPVQLYAACDLKFPAALYGPQFLSGTYLKKPLVVKDGEFDVPAEAGLGVEIGEVRIKL